MTFLGLNVINIDREDHHNSTQAGFLYILFNSIVGPGQSNALGSPYPPRYNTNTTYKHKGDNSAPEMNYNISFTIHRCTQA